MPSAATPRNGSGCIAAGKPAPPESPDLLAHSDGGYLLTIEPPPASTYPSDGHKNNERAHQVQEENHLVKIATCLILGLALALFGCSTPTAFVPHPLTSVTPSATGTPNSVATFGNLEFVSVQGTGQIFTYNLSSGLQVLAGSPYATPCADPSGMVIATIAGRNVLAVVC